MIDDATKTKDIFDLEEVIALLPGHVYMKDRQHVYRLCNNEAAKTIHLKNRKGIIGKTLHDFAPKRVADKVTRTDERIMQSGQTFSMEEMAFDQTGHKAVYLSKKVPLKDKKGDVIGLLGISVDITKQKRLEESLQIEKEKAESANNAKTRLIMGMGHDFRTPFSGILGLSQYLVAKEANPERKDLLTSIMESAENLLMLLDEVFLLATFDNESSLENVEFDLIKLINDMYKVMLPKTVQKKLQLLLSIDSALPKKVIGNEYAVKRILLNLLGNAIKFTDDGTVEIAVSLKQQKEDQYIIEMKVSDTGPGIPKDKQDIIFEQFSKLNISQKGKSNGAGLGLWFVKELTKKLKGTIHLDSSMGQGTTFTCVFPINKMTD